MRIAPARGPDEFIPLDTRCLPPAAFSPGVSHCRLISFPFPHPEKIDDKRDVRVHGFGGRVGIVPANGVHDGLVLLDDSVQVGRVGIEVLQVFPDAEKEHVVEAPHDVDLHDIAGGVGDGHVEGEIGVAAQPFLAASDFLDHLL